MSELTKIRDLSVKYNVSARALKYYEDMGLIKSEKSNDYAYRMYDDDNIKKIEQILILRKLNISIKDIQRVFNTVGTDVVLEILSKKVEDIDEEVSLLHELKEIITEFIMQIEKIDFTKTSDVQSLYEKASEIKKRLNTTEYTGNPSPGSRLQNVTEKLKEKSFSRLLIPNNVLKRLLENVYFIWGSNEGISVANELGKRYGIYVYHTCENRLKHSKHADPQLQPGLSRQVQDLDFFAQDPEDAIQWERDIIHDFTPMVIMDLIQLTADNEKVICENDIDIDSIINFVTHSVTISNQKTIDGFFERYENEIQGRTISKDEKKKLICKLHEISSKGDFPIWRTTVQYGIKQIVWDDNSTIEEKADEIAKHFEFFQ